MASKPDNRSCVADIGVRCCTDVSCETCERGRPMSDTRRRAITSRIRGLARVVRTVQLLKAFEVRS